MDRFTSSIRKSIKDENWFSALFLALAMPDVCAALESPPTGKWGEVRERYEAWFNKYLQRKYDPRSLHDLVLARNPDTIAQIGPEGLEYLKQTPTHAACAFTASDCYRFRCKCLHQGLIEKDGGTTFIFTTPPPNGAMVHCSSLNGLFQLQIDVFCEDICLAVEEWVKDTGGREDIAARSRELIDIRHYSQLAPHYGFSS